MEEVKVKESYRLKTEILKRSNSTDWNEAKKEWNLESITTDETVSSTCLCGHFPIKQLCHLHNPKTNNKAIVGNCCVNKFIPELESNKIFTSISKVSKSLDNTLNKKTLAYCLDRDIITKFEYEVGRSFNNKKNFNAAQTLIRRIINRKALMHINNIDIPLNNIYEGVETNTLSCMILPMIVLEEAIKQNIITHDDISFVLRMESLMKYKNELFNNNKFRLDNMNKEILFSFFELEENEVWDFKYTYTEVKKQVDKPKPTTYNNNSTYNSYGYNNRNNDNYVLSNNSKGGGKLNLASLKMIEHRFNKGYKNEAEVKIEKFNPNELLSSEELNYITDEIYEKYESKLNDWQKKFFTNIVDILKKGYKLSEKQVIHVRKIIDFIKTIEN